MPILVLFMVSKVYPCKTSWLMPKFGGPKPHWSGAGALQPSGLFLLSKTLKTFLGPLGDLGKNFYGIFMHPGGLYLDHPLNYLEYPKTRVVCTKNPFFRPKLRHKYDQLVQFGFFSFLPYNVGTNRASR